MDLSHVTNVSSLYAVLLGLPPLMLAVWRAREIRFPALGLTIRLWPPAIGGLLGLTMGVFGVALGTGFLSLAALITLLATFPALRTHFWSFVAAGLAVVGLVLTVGCTVLAVRAWRTPSPS